jgi:hypothetical protein
MAEGFTDDEIEAARAVTPGCREVIHLNHAGASPPPQVVVDVECRALPPLLRMSVHYTTTTGEPDAAVAAIVDQVRGR